MNRFPEQFVFYFIKDGVKTLCVNAPEEWNDNVIKWDRDRKSCSILTKYVEEFTFVLDDADYLRRCFNENGVFSKVRFFVEEYDSASFTYSLYYSADIDFYSYEETDFTIKVVMFDLGYKTAIVANLNTKYEIDIPKTPDVVYYDRLKLKNLIVFENGYAMYNECTKPTAMELFVSDDSVYNDLITYQSVMQGAKNNDNWIVKSDGKDEILINLSMSLSIGIFFPFDALPNETRVVCVRVYVNDIVKTERSMVVKRQVTGNAGYPIYIKIDENIPLVEGYKVYATFHTSGGKVPYTAITQPIIKVSFSSRSNPRNIMGLRPIQLLEKLIEKATEGRYSLIKSSLLTESEMSHMLISSGDAIRSIQGAKIKTSLNDFFDAFKVIGGACYTFDVQDGIERMVVEHINTFFDRNNRLTRLNDIKDFKRSVANDYIYNVLKVGYKDNTYDEVNGRNEFNTELEFSTNADVKSNELKLISPYRADMYGIEFLLQNYESEETRDSQSDNDIFIIHTGGKKENEVYLLNRSEQSSNVLAGDSAFNVFLSPKHCMLRQIEYIKSLFGFSGSLLKFTSSPKEFNMASSIGEEHADVDLSEHDNLFNPVQYEFETTVDSNISKLIGTNYNGYIDIHGKAKGFILSVSENPGRNKSQTWKLLELESNNT